jgi:adenine phosphoribosyltransferase
MHEDAIKPGQKVIIIDDLLATGGTAKAMVEMVDKAGGQMFEAGFMIELDFLKGRELLGSLPIYSMLHY